jgi:hypothetical protein
MTLRSLHAEYEAKNGSIFHFWLYGGQLCADRNAQPYTTVKDITPEVFAKECAALVDAYDKVHPR